MSDENYLRSTPDHLLSSQERKRKKALLEADKVREQANRTWANDRARNPKRSGTTRIGNLAPRAGGMGLPPGWGGGASGTFGNKNR